jgi:hypothetical protein
MELMQKRVEFIQTMKESMIDMDKEGNEIKYFSSKFLVQKYLKYSSEDIKLNKKLKEQEIEELNLAGSDSGGDENPFGESIINYDKLADMIVERLSAKANMITEEDEESDEDKKSDECNKAPKRRKKSKKKTEEE